MAGTGPISELAQTIAKREIEKNPNSLSPKQRQPWEPEPAPGRPEQAPISPEIAALIGLGTDAFGTYKMLDAGAGAEANPTLVKLFNHNPAKTGLGVAAGGLGMMAARNLLRKVGGKPGNAIADMLAGQLGADQLSLGIQNLQRTYDIPFPGAINRWGPDTRNGFERNAERQLNAVSGVQK